MSSHTWTPPQEHSTPSLPTKRDNLPPQGTFHPLFPPCIQLPLLVPATSFSGEVAYTRFLMLNELNSMME